MLKDRLEGQPDDKPIRLLIVDDSPFARKELRMRLEPLGCEVVAEAENGAQAVQLFRELRPELVTLDVLMPGDAGLDSFAAFQEMRKIDSGAVFLVVSANRYAPLREKFIHAGAFYYIQKPFTRQYMELLRIRLSRAFPGHRWH